MHFNDARKLLAQDRRLGKTKLGIGHRAQYPTAINLSKASCQSGTLCAPTTVVARFG
jgi:hypothetical protein